MEMASINVCVTIIFRFYCLDFPTRSRYSSCPNQVTNPRSQPSRDRKSIWLIIYSWVCFYVYECLTISMSV